ncbi:MAG: type II secretion system protein [Planctomycetota bacterium]
MQQTLRRPSGRGGFTLVELLVVVAIISILAGLLLPALGSALDASRSSSCINNLSQMGRGMRFYFDDFDNWIMCEMPLEANAGDQDNPGYYQAVLDLLDIDLGPYTTKGAIANWNGEHGGTWSAGRNAYEAWRELASVAWCPSDSFFASANATDYGATWRNAGAVEAKAVSYGYPLYTYKYYATAASGTPWFLGWSRMGAAKKASETLMLVETDYHLWMSTTNAMLANAFENDTPVRVAESYYVHANAPNSAYGRIFHGNLNWLYCDGHVSTQATPPYSLEAGQYEAEVLQ